MNSLASKYGSNLGALAHGYKRSGGWWLSGGIAAANCVAAYQPKGAADIAASYINLANPGTYNLTVGVAPTWDAASGWIASTSGKYLKTGYIGNENTTIIIRCSDVVSSAYAAICGHLMTGDVGINLTVSISGGNTRYYFGNKAPRVGSGRTGGVFCWNKTAGYYNGNSDVAVNYTGTLNMGVYDLWLIGCGYNNAFISSVVCKVQAAALYNTTLTPTQILALSTAMAAL